MRMILSCFLLSQLLLACNGDDGGAEGDVVLLDDASDEVLVTLRDLEARGEIVTDDEMAVRLTAPADGAELASDAPPTFEWSPPESTLRHGRNTGDFVWLSIDCPDLSEPIDILAIETPSWQPDDERWEKLKGATGACEAAVVSAYVDRGIVSEGAYRASANPSFTIAP